MMVNKRKAIPKSIRMTIYQKCDGHCAYCGCSLEYKDMQIDHVIPLNGWSEQGTDTVDNMLPACRSCNHYKSRSTLEGFRKMVEAIDLLLDIAKTFIPRDIKVSKIKLNAAEDILNILSENTRVILPVQSGKTPHYVVLQSHNGRIVTCCNGGMVEKHSYKKLFRLHKNVKNKYDWKKFEVCSKFDFYINCKRYKLSEQEIQMWSRDWKDNRERLKMLRKRGKQEVKMKGYCLLFYR